MSALPALVGNDIQVAGLVGDLIVDGSRHKAVVEAQGRDDGLHRAGSAQHMARHGLGGADHQLVGVAAEGLADGRRLTGVVEGRGGAVGVDVVHILQLEAAVGHGFGHGSGSALAVGGGRSDVIGVTGSAVADNFGVDLRAAGLGVFQLLQHQDAGALAHDETAALLVKGNGGPVRVRGTGTAPSWR